MSVRQKDKAIVERLKGMTCALATPLTATGKVDYPAVGRLVDHVIDGGVAGILALGWMGEQPLLPEADRAKVVGTIVKRAKGRVPVIAGCSEQSVQRAVELAKTARAAGADAILSTPPYSYDTGLTEALEYFEALVKAAKLPLVVYNNAETGVTLDVATAKKLRDMPGVLGIKDTSSMQQVQELVRRVHAPGKFVILSGDEYLFGPALFVGCRYTTMGGPGNLNPHWIADIHKKAEAGEWAAVAKGYDKLLRFWDDLYAVGSGYVATKVALAKMGFGSGKALAPLPAFNAKQVAAVGRVLKKHKAVLEAPKS